MHAVSKTTHWSVSGTIRGAIGYLAFLRRAMRDRKDLQTLLEASDAHLLDIGISRADVRNALNLPLSHPAGRDLSYAALQRSRKNTG